MLPNIAFSFLLLITTTKGRMDKRKKTEMSLFCWEKRKLYKNQDRKYIYKKLRNDGGLIFKLGLNFELVNTKKIFCLLLRLIVSTKVW